MNDKVITKVLTWLAAAVVRAVKTAAQAALGVMSAASLMGDVSWVMVGSAALFSAIYSIITSVAGIPEIADGASLMKLIKGAE